jgi:uncharacterized protein (TIGR03083 family)
LPAVQHDERVDAVERELAAVDEALAAGPMSATVPTCPEWSVADLARHLGEFCGFWAHVLCEGTGRDKPSFAMPADDAALPGWFAGIGRALAEQLRTPPPDTAVWTWHPTDKTPRFVARRSANELAIHRYDLESARGTCRPIDRALAVEGVEEIVDSLIEGAESTGEARGETLHLHGTDAVPAGDGAEWLLTLHPDRIEATSDHTEADLADLVLRGAVSDLELLLYGRPALGPVERLGNEAVLDLWQREFRF